MIEGCLGALVVERRPDHPSSLMQWRIWSCLEWALKAVDISKNSIYLHLWCSVPSHEQNWEDSVVCIPFFTPMLTFLPFTNLFSVPVTCLISPSTVPCLHRAVLKCLIHSLHPLLPNHILHSFMHSSLTWYCYAKLTTSSSALSNTITLLLPIFASSFLLLQTLSNYFYNSL